MEILKLILLPLFGVIALAVLLYFVARMFLSYRNAQQQPGDNKVVTTARLQAYERLALLLERVNPNNLVVKRTEAGQNCDELQDLLTRDIRREFEHNASQQIYVSEVLWEEIEEARESLLQLIGGCASRCNASDPSAALASMILEFYNTPEETADKVALRHLKEEVQQFFK